ncbi:MAG: 50S ribosomal protein L18e [Candidatus Altiarchaeota archaeon]
MPQSVEYKNPGRITLIKELRSAAKINGAPIWKSIAEELSRSRRQRREVNLRTINQYTKKDETAIVAGKVLGDGFLDHKVDIAAFKFTEGARKKIEGTGGKVLSIDDLIKNNPKGSKVRIIG